MRTLNNDSGKLQNGIKDLVNAEGSWVNTTGLVARQINADLVTAGLGNVSIPGVAFKANPASGATANSPGFFVPSANVLAVAIGGLEKLRIDSSDVIVKGNLVTTGNVTYINTEAQITDQLLVTNDGTGPAIRARQNGTEPVFEVMDDANVTFKVYDGGFVGIAPGTSTALATDVPISSNLVAVLGNVRADTLFANVQGTSLTGNGAGISGLSASNVSSGTLSNARLPSAIAVATVNANFSGDAFGISNVSASNISSGTLSNARLPSVVTVANVSANGAGLSSLNASNIGSGTLSNSRLPADISVSNIQVQNANVMGPLVLGNVLNMGSRIQNNLICLWGDSTNPAATNTYSLGINGYTLRYQAGYYGLIGRHAFYGDTTLYGNISPTGFQSANIGTAASPAYSFTSDDNTGIFSPAADTLSISTAGTQKVVVDPSGNVGIGVGAPTSNLHVLGTANVTANLAVANVVLGDGGVLTAARGDPGVMVEKKYGGSDNRYGLGQYTGGIFRLHSAGSFAPSTIRFGAALSNGGFNDVVTVTTGNTSSGNVGINTTAPTSALHVVGSANVTASVTAASVTANLIGDGFGISNVSASNISSGVLSNSRLPSVISVANVGLGIATPTSNLHVVGSTQLQGFVNIQQITEKTVSLTGATGVVTHDLSSAALFVHSSPAANFTVNLTNVPTTNDRSVTFTLVINQGATAYVANALQIDGAAATVNWSGGGIPVGGSNKKDVQSFTLLRSANAWTALGSLATYG